MGQAQAWTHNPKEKTARYKIPAPRCHHICVLHMRQHRGATTLAAGVAGVCQGVHQKDVETSLQRFPTASQLPCVAPQIWLEHPGLVHGVLGVAGCSFGQLAWPAACAVAGCGKVPLGASGRCQGSVAGHLVVLHSIPAHWAVPALGCSWVLYVQGVLDAAILATEKQK